VRDLLKYLVLIFFLLESKATFATGAMLPDLFFTEDDGKFVEWPALAGTYAGGAVGAIIGVPLAIVGGGSAIAMDEDLDTGVKIGFLAPVLLFGYIGNVVVGAPFWGVKEVFYELPSKAINKEPENITN